jgi:hypothetical protein
MAVTIRGSGQVPVQMATTVKTDTFTTTSTSMTDITGMSVTITPTNASNKILIQVALSTGINNNGRNFVNIVRNSTTLTVGDTAGSRTSCMGTQYSDSANNAASQFQLGLVFLDSPATTSATTYKLQMSARSGNTATVNRSFEDTDNVVFARCISTITVMEIAYA